MALAGQVQEPFVPADPEPGVRSNPTGADSHAEAPPVESSSPVPEEIIPLNEIEKRHILAALRHTGGNRTRAANMLGISIRTLRNKLQEYRAAGFIDAGDDSPG
jgi:DNA-binding NtrC family response regulator